MLLGAAGAALVAGLVMTLVAWLVSDATAVRSVLLRAPCWSWVVIGFGVFVLNTVASVMPGATVLVALVTYALQLVVMAAVVLQLVRSGMMADTLDRRWFGGGVAVATVAWMVAQMVSHDAGADPRLRPPGGGCVMTHHTCYRPVRDGSAEGSVDALGRTPSRRPLVGVLLPRLGCSGLRPHRLGSRSMAGHKLPGRCRDRVRGRGWAIYMTFGRFGGLAARQDKQS